MSSKQTSYFQEMTLEDSKINNTAILKLSDQCLGAFLFYSIVIFIKKVFDRHYSYKQKTPKEFNYTLY